MVVEWRRPSTSGTARRAPLQGRFGSRWSKTSSICSSSCATSRSTRSEPDLRSRRIGRGRATRRLPGSGRRRVPRHRRLHRRSARPEASSTGSPTSWRARTSTSGCPAIPRGRARDAPRRRRSGARRARTSARLQRQAEIARHLGASRVADQPTLGRLAPPARSGSDPIVHAGLVPWRRMHLGSDSTRRRRSHPSAHAVGSSCLWSDVWRSDDG